MNRMNLAQIQEQFINFMSDHVIKIMSEMHSRKEQEDLLFEYVGRLNKDQCEFMKSEYKNFSNKEKDEFWNDIFTKGIFIHQAPFFGNTEFKEFKQIMVDHPEWCDKYKFVGIEKEMVMGDLYFIRLKHEPANKSSMRSATNLNTKNLPAKSTLKRDHKILYSQNPLRLGEMEVNNLLLTKDGKMVKKLLKSYSTSKEARGETITSLLKPSLSNDGKKNDVFNMDLQVKNHKSISSEILEKYLNFLELGIVNDEEE